MKAIYLEDSSKRLKHFICGINDDDDCYSFYGLETISEKAFASSDIKQSFFEDALSFIKKESFKDCEELRIFCCGKIGGDTKLEKGKESKSDGEDEKSKILEGASIKGIRIYEVSSDFVVETSAFAGCDKLHTVILPQCETLKIEKNAFAGCSFLRTVAVLARKIEFTENPFSDCPKDLTFVCKPGSDVERFARENGYRYVNV